MHLSAAVRPEASTIAHKDSAASGDSIRVMRGGDDPRVADADRDTSGETRDRIEGPAAPKEVSELRVAHLLVERLNAHGQKWSPPEPPDGPEEGVDAVANHGDVILKVQVTTPEDMAWRELVSKPEFGRTESSVAPAVEAIRRAIERKANFAGRGEIVLALDATDSPRYALRGILDAFRAQHGSWAATIGYEAIWMVGPAATLIHRLDV